MVQSSEAEVIERILTTSHSIAVVGLSDKPERPSHQVARYLQSFGYRIISVNPTLSEILGEQTHADLLSIPEPIDVVDIFRHPEAAQRAEEAGLLVVMDHCMMKETKRLIAACILARSSLTQCSGADRDRDEGLRARR